VTDPIGDALDTNTPVFHTPDIVAEWKELPPGYYDASVASVNYDNLAALGDQLGPGGYTANQSLIDGLPDNVSMTGSNDGFGTLEADLIGRPPNRSRNFGSRGASNSGSGTSATIGVHSQVEFMNLQIVAIAFDSPTVIATDRNADPFDRFAWKPLAEVIDGNIKMVMWWRYWYTGAPSLILDFSESVNFTWQSNAYWSTEASAGTWLHLKPGTPVTFAETVSQTLHTLPSIDMGAGDGRRGFLHAHMVCPSANGPWTAAAGTTEMSDIAGAVLNVTAIRSGGLSSRNAQALASSTTTATSNVAGIVVPIIYLDRVEMPASAYFSPYRTDSPLYGFDRDTAPVWAEANVFVPGGGYLGERVFTGTMSDINAAGSSATATLSAASATRVALDKARTPPWIWGRREGLTIDWFANWLMAQGGQTVGPGPNRLTRLWAPFYGSTRAFCFGSTDWDEVGRRTTDDLGVYQRHFYPEEVEGPYVSGMFGCWTNTKVDEPYINFGRDARFRSIPGIDQPDNYDFMSQANSEGRWSAWIRCDPYLNGLPAAMNGDTSNTYLFNFTLSARTQMFNTGFVAGGVNAGGFTFIVDPTVAGGAQPQVSMGTEAGYSTVALTSSGWPSDGQWHFIGGAWNFATGNMKFRFDNLTWTTNHLGTSGPSFISSLYATEDDNFKAGGYVSRSVYAHLPIADFRCDVGPGTYADPWTGVWPKPDPVATYRRTAQWMEALAETAPLAGWDTLQEVAQATGSGLRINENDVVEFMPPSYYGEPDQLEIASVADTEVNASALDINIDPSKSRNVVSVQYAETVTDSRLQDVLKYTNSLLIRPGVHEMIFASDIPVLELHGANAPFSGTLFIITPLTASQIATPSTIPTVHYMTVNSKAAGNGTVPPAGYVTGRVVGQESANSIRVRIINTTRQNYYLVNSGAEVAYLRILGYSLKVSDAYVSTRDEASIRLRGERTLDHPTRWIHRRVEALTLAGQIAGRVSVPRGEATVTVIGDPRRKPGDLVTIADSVGTQAEGIWRILSVQHQGFGPKYVQVLRILRIGSVMNWDEDPGWNLGVWGE
jgi:hypothetical protein